MPLLRDRSVLAALLCALLHAPAAAAACPEWLLRDMLQRAVPQREISRFCGPPASRSLASPAGPPALGLLDLRVREEGSRRCVPETGAACDTQSPRPQGSPCWCGDAALPREGTIR